jgi:hypothetical protein
VDEYLPPDTLRWCRVQLLEMGFDPDDPNTYLEDDPKAPYLAIYLELRGRVNLHMEGHPSPQLGLSSRPVGAFNWQPDTSAVLRSDEINLASYQDEFESDDT